jgi:hypothetical protein
VVMIDLRTGEEDRTGSQGACGAEEGRTKGCSEDGGTSVIGYRRQPITFIFSPVDHKPAMPHPSPNCVIQIERIPPIQFGPRG